MGSTCTRTTSGPGISSSSRQPSPSSGRRPAFTPAYHPGRPGYLFNLGAALQTRFESTGLPTDLDQAADRLSGAIDAAPADHPDRHRYLSSLGRALGTRFQRTGQPADLDRAIILLGEAVDVAPAGYPDRHQYLFNLATALALRFERTRQQADSDRAITLFAEAIDAAPAGHLDRPAYLSNLGVALRARFESTRRRADLDRAIKAFRDGAGVLTASPARRLTAARGWGQCAMLAGTPASAVKGNTTAIELLPLVARHGLDQATRELNLRESAGLASDAAAAAVAAGRPAQAVELLEAGRSVLWTQALQQRQDQAELREHAPALAAVLEASRAALNSPIRGPDAGRDIGQLQAAEHMLQERRQAARDWDAAMDQVRLIEGFEHFLRPVPFTDLRAAATGGPVVIVNISNHGSHALIVTPATGPSPDPAVLVVDLPAAPADTVIDQANTLLGVLRRAGNPATDLGTKDADRHAVFSILAWSWQTITEPVLTALGHVHTPAERIED